MDEAASAADAGELWVLIGHFVAYWFGMWVESRFNPVDLVVLAKGEEYEAEVIDESMGRMTVSSGGRRHERASSRNCCFGSWDGEWLRKNQRVGSEGLVAIS